MIVEFLTLVLDSSSVKAYATIQAEKTTFMSGCSLLIEAFIDVYMVSLFNDHVESDSYHDQHNFGNSSHSQRAWDIGLLFQ